MFKKIQFESGKMFNIALAISQTIAVGDGLVWSSGYLTAAAADEEIIDFVAEEAVTTDGSSHTKCLCSPASKSNIRYEVDVSANTAVTQLGSPWQLSDVNTVDNEDAAGANGFVADEIVGAAADKKMRGYFF